MRPSEDCFPAAPSASNFTKPIPIVHVSSSSPSSTISSSAPAGAPPPPEAAMPVRRPDHEPAVVLGCANGEVRRMRSVLDMKLGAMAGSLPLVVSTVSSGVNDGRDCFSNIAERKRKTDAPAVDVFGIAIPRSIGKEQSEVDLWSTNDNGAEIGALERKCSIVLAESPSRLDLSALLC